MFTFCRTWKYHHSVVYCYPNLHSPSIIIIIIIIIIIVIIIISSEITELENKQKLGNKNVEIKKVNELKYLDQF